ncbi:hypothetical protein AVEN_50529-1 [Araneus ventricosus]|uniref:Uncharacterized protein n=1 Tax=Araneus ventricosus TaxID=182803 RepID=A0A4Y2AQ28_ARAVE|nr:hypothetical protein AVEN_50529-1 [Araneus ventricosus]
MTLWWQFHCLILYRDRVALLYHWYGRRWRGTDWIKENHLFGVQQVFNCSSSRIGIVVPPAGFHIFEWGGVRRDDRACLPIKNNLYCNDVVEWRERGGFKGAEENEGCSSILRGPALPLLWYAFELVLLYIRFVSQEYVDFVL